MSEEIFDVVNERDEVIDQAPRSEVHRRKLQHRLAQSVRHYGDSAKFTHLRQVTLEYRLSQDFNGLGSRKALAPG